LNTWLINFDTVSPFLRQSLKSTDTEIEIVMLDIESKHALDREHELRSRDLKTAINASLDALAFFLDSLQDA